MIPCYKPFITFIKVFKDGLSHSYFFMFSAFSEVGGYEALIDKFFNATAKVR
jgi:hypothetical protein